VAVTFKGKASFTPLVARTITFVTSNKGKLHEASTKLAPLGYHVVGADLDPTEIQADSLAEVARAKCEVLVGRLQAPFFVDDGGLFVDHYAGFPGVYSAHALRTIGVDGILRLMRDVPPADRAAYFAAVIGYHDGARVHTFAGRVDGHLATAPHSDGHGFGFDPIFVPAGHDKTFAQLPAETKNTLSHRGMALDALVAHLEAQP